MAEIHHLESRHDVIFFCRGWSDLDKILRTDTEWHVDCGDVWKWKPYVAVQYGRPRTFGRIQWHVIRQPRVTLQGAATWWIHCHDSRAACHTTGCSHLTKSMSWSCHIAGCKNSIWHIENRFSPYFIFFLFLMQFRLWWAAAFVSSPIHLFHNDYWLPSWHCMLLSKWEWHTNTVSDRLTDHNPVQYFQILLSYICSQLFWSVSGVD